jgi:hypothetical protein
MDESVVELIIEEARGNPLGLLEPSRAVSPADFTVVPTAGRPWTPSGMAGTEARRPRG